MVVGDVQSAAHAGGEHRLQPTGLAAGEPLRVQAEPPVEGVQFAQFLAVVGVQGDGEGAALPVAGVQAAARLGEFGGEGRPALVGGHAEAEQGLLAVLEFGDRGEHAGRDLRGAAAGGRVEHSDPEAPPGRLPGDHEPDDPAADHQHLGAVARCQACQSRCSPFAGMTRIRFGRSRAVPARLSARSAGLP